jgi:excisionase family DNA binding protein
MSRATPPSRRILTTTQAAALLGVHERTLRRYVSMGLLAHRRLPGGHYRIPEDALNDFWQANERPTPSRARPRQSRVAPRSSQRRLPLGNERQPVSYDLSTEALSELRARLS